MPNGVVFSFPSFLSVSDACDAHHNVGGKDVPSMLDVPAASDAISHSVCNIVKQVSRAWQRYALVPERYALVPERYALVPVV